MMLKMHVAVKCVVGKIRAPCSLAANDTEIRLEPS